ncbi:PhzF family phenazine biosynthesis protein, partial [Marilutibacter aestuarii]
RWWVVELADEATVRTATPDWDAVAALAADTGSMGVFAFSRADAGQDHDLVVRAFVGAGARFEDAASGAANATLAAWLRHNGAVPGEGGRYVASQGREVGYDARLHLRIDEAGDIWSGGQACDVLSGELDWPGT